MYVFTGLRELILVLCCGVTTLVMRQKVSSTINVQGVKKNAVLTSIRQGIVVCWRNRLCECANVDVRLPM